VTTTVCLIPGDGIGLEVIREARRVLEALAPGLRFVESDAGFGAFERTGDALPKETIAAVRAADVTLLGAVGSPSRPVEGYRSPVVRLRRELDLFACVRPVRTPPLAGAREGVDLVIVRESTEGLYSGLETKSPGRAVAERVITREASFRIAEFARDLALREGRRRVTVVHKANVLRATCGLFREAAFEALEGSGLEINEALVDSAAYQLVVDPERFDVIVTTNLFGDILSDVAAAHGGGLGLVPSASLGPAHAIFEPVHGSAPDIEGRGIANPLATLRATVMMLRYLKLPEYALALDEAIDDVLAHGPRPCDLGGNARTVDVADAVLDRIASFRLANSVHAARRI
jgi:homoisocitrate dehydrogenase